MNSMERVLSALSFKEPDRVPLMLLLSTYGAKEMNMSVEDYFNSTEKIIEAQIQMQKKYMTDCYYTFLYAGIELEAWGGKVDFVEAGPPNTSTPIIKDKEDIINLKMPIIEKCNKLKSVLHITEELAKVSKGEIPIIGVVMSPFSVPIMQMGFENYIKLIYSDEKTLNTLLRKNTEFCVEWANQQIKAGANAICYFDPMSSTSIIDRETYKKYGFNLVTEVIERVDAPIAIHLASGKTEGVVDLLRDTGAVLLGTSTDDDLKTIKSMAEDKIAILGNMNGIEMAHWKNDDVEAEVKGIIKACGFGGGLLISDNHGEIPYQVPEDTLMEISKTVIKWGKYPLDWTKK